MSEEDCRIINLIWLGVNTLLSLYIGILIAALKKVILVAKSLREFWDTQIRILQRRYPNDRLLKVEKD
jgi:hypothetical protein